MTGLRVFGQNMGYYMLQNGISAEAMGRDLGYSVNEIIRAKDSRLFLDADEKRAIADYLGIAFEDMTADTHLIENEENGSIEYRGKFSSPSNRDVILNLFDAYCDIQELLTVE